MDGGGPAAVAPVVAQQPDGGTSAGSESEGLSGEQQQELFGQALLSAALPTAILTYGQTLRTINENKDIVED